MTVVYRIRDWDRHFETAQSRKAEMRSWVSLPNKQSGMGLTRILAQPDGLAIYGIWCLIIGACSHQPAPREGWMTTDGTATGLPWTIEDLAERWRCEPAAIARALDVITSAKVGWIERLEKVVDDSQLSTTRLPTIAQCRVESSRVESGRVESARATPAPGDDREENRRWLRTYLARQRFACDPDALEEWAGLIADARCTTIPDAQEFLRWVKVRGRQEGIGSRYARDYERFLAAWRARSRPEEGAA